MDIQSDKLELIKWLTEVDDVRIIKQFKILQQSNLDKMASELTTREKSAIDQGMKSIAEGNVHRHADVLKAAKKKYPTLFK